MTTHEGLNLYEPLANGEIRLVKVFMDSPDQRVRCELLKTTIEKAVAERETSFWTAASYEWGDVEETTNIYLNGQDFPVTINLFHFLQNYRRLFTEGYNESGQNPCEPEGRSTESQTLWIDAICINQLDEDERAIQLTHLTEIYAKATIVIAYVGELDKPDQVGFDTIFDLCWRMTNQNSVDSIGRSIQGDVKAGELTSFNPLADSLRDFFERRFFSRVWTVQELVMGSQTAGVLLMCGTKIIPLNTLKTLAKDILFPAATHLDDDRLVTFSTHVWPCFSLADTLRVHPRDTPSGVARRLLWLLHATWSHNATDARDKIYGLLGLLDAKIEMPAELAPSYRIPPEKVYHNYAKWLIENIGDATILEGRPLVHDSMPSWVTNMARPTTYEFVDLLFRAGDLPQRLLGAIRLSDDHQIVFATGVCFGQVTSFYEGMSSGTMSWSNLAHQLLAFEFDIVQKLCGLRPGIDRDAVIDQILSSIGGPCKRFDSVREAYTEAVTRLSPTGYHISVRVSRLAELSYLFGRSWILLDDNSVWHAPAASRTNYRAPAKGDFVYYFKGSDHAAIVRHDEQTHKNIRIDLCDNAEASSDFLHLTEEEWSVIGAPEVAIS
ncbi:hypothetical protein PV04_05463 [Phialophora macrospora]|uniref:Heterokaryon incompatibility domain-containing protein n=1 Tax=Phialophora macrospora TaxID=1851006 RepID=A0A0D2FN09_9EURO|nr:hypothetical protein PV04_05463 [Phialophora macrospora]